MPGCAERNSPPWPASRLLHDDTQTVAFEREIVADLRLATARYPDDPELTTLVTNLGAIALDCEVLTVAGSDLKMVVYTAEPNAPDAANLDLLHVLGIQRLTQSG